MVNKIQHFYCHYKYYDVDDNDDSNILCDKEK